MCTKRYQNLCTDILSRKNNFKYKMKEYLQFIYQIALMQSLSCKYMFYKNTDRRNFPNSERNLDPNMTT